MFIFALSVVHSLPSIVLKPDLKWVHWFMYSRVLEYFDKECALADA